jgi:hypothetical protein
MRRTRRARPPTLRSTAPAHGEAEAREPVSCNSIFAAACNELGLLLLGLVALDEILELVEESRESLTLGVTAHAARTRSVVGRLVFAPYDMQYTGFITLDANGGTVVGVTALSSVARSRRWFGLREVLMAPLRQRGGCALQLDPLRVGEPASRDPSKRPWPSFDHLCNQGGFSIDLKHSNEDGDTEGVVVEPSKRFGCAKIIQRALLQRRVE